MADDKHTLTDDQISVTRAQPSTPMGGPRPAAGPDVGPIGPPDDADIQDDADMSDNADGDSVDKGDVTDGTDKGDLLT
jgi:hypothetical protein